MARRYPKYNPAVAEARAKSRTHHEKCAAMMDELLPQITEIANNLLCSGGLNMVCDQELLSIRSVEVLLTVEIGLTNFTKLSS